MQEINKLNELAIELTTEGSSPRKLNLNLDRFTKTKQTEKRSDGVVQKVLGPLSPHDRYGLPSWK